MWWFGKHSEVGDAFPHLHSLCWNKTILSRLRGSSFQKGGGAEREQCGMQRGGSPVSKEAAPAATRCNHCELWAITINLTGDCRIFTSIANCGQPAQRKGGRILAWNLIIKETKRS